MRNGQTGRGPRTGELIVRIGRGASSDSAGTTGKRAAGVRAADDLEPALRSLAHRYLSTVLDPQVLALRRLIIGESSRFPEPAVRRAADRAVAVFLGSYRRTG